MQPEVRRSNASSSSQHIICVNEVYRYAVPHSSPEVSAQFPIRCMYLMGSNWSSACRSASRGIFLLLLLCIVRLQLGSSQGGLGLGSVVGLGLACGLVLRLGLVSGLYKWLFYLANCEATQQRRFLNIFFSESQTETESLTESSAVRVRVQLGFVSSTGAWVWPPAAAIRPATL